MVLTENKRIAWNKGLKTGKQSPETIAKGLKMSDDYRKKLSELKIGDKHWNWQGGKSRNKQCGFEYFQWRSNIFQRDNWTCQTCGKRGVKLEAHHIKSWAKYPELRYDLDNGVSLCLDCHKLTDNYKGKGNKGSKYKQCDINSGSADNSEGQTPIQSN